MRMDNKTFERILIGDRDRLQRTLTNEEIEVFSLLSGDIDPTHFSGVEARMLWDRHKDAGHSIRKIAHRKVTHV